MNRTIKLQLNKFPKTPPALVDQRTGKAVPEVTVAVKKLLHHYFLAKYGDGGEDCREYEYERRITGGPDWRFKGEGIGVDKESKRNVSNELGKAFSRWFLDEYLGFTYFTPLEDLLERPNADGSRWTRRTKGDLPDYVCGKDATDLNILEAKGRYRSLSFSADAFQSFRQQVQRAQFLDGSGRAVQIKGFVGVARWATEATPKVRAKLLIEDPRTQGRPPGPDGYPRAAGQRMIWGHYGPIFDRMQLPVHAAALRNAVALPERTTAARGKWECVSGPLQGRRFIGGLLPDRATRLVEPWWPFFDEEGPRRVWQLIRRVSPFVLARPLRFFGIEEHVFNSVLSAIQGGVDTVHEIEQSDVPAQTQSLSLLRDGTVLGPADYFEPIGVREF